MGLSITSVNANANFQKVEKLEMRMFLKNMKKIKNKIKFIYTVKLYKKNERNKIMKVSTSVE